MFLIGNPETRCSKNQGVDHRGRSPSNIQGTYTEPGGLTEGLGGGIKILGYWESRLDASKQGPGEMS